MAENKTKPTVASVTDFLNSIKEEQKRSDSFAVLEIMQKASGETPKMWGSSIIGFGQVKIKRPNSGREVEWFRIGFSPRKASLSLYLNGSLKKYDAALKKLGKHKTGVGCLYINKMEDVDMEILQEIIDAALRTDYFDK